MTGWNAGGQGTAGECPLADPAQAAGGPERRINKLRILVTDGYRARILVPGAGSAGALGVALDTSEPSHARSPLYHVAGGATMDDLVDTVLERLSAEADRHTFDTMWIVGPPQFTRDLRAALLSDLSFHGVAVIAQQCADLGGDELWTNMAGRWQGGPHEPRTLDDLEADALAHIRHHNGGAVA